MPVPPTTWTELSVRFANAGDQAKAYAFAESLKGTPGYGQVLERLEYAKVTGQKRVDLQIDAGWLAQSPAASEAMTRLQLTDSQCFAPPKKALLNLSGDPVRSPALAALVGLPPVAPPPPPQEMTLSELMDALAAGPTAEQYWRLVDAGAKLPLHGPFAAVFAAAAFRALPSAADHFEGAKNLAKLTSVLAGRGDAAAPAASRMPFLASPAALAQGGGTNAILSSKVAQLTGYPKDVAIAELTRQGFADAAQVDGAHGHALLGSRPAQGLDPGLTVIAFRGTLDLDDVVEDGKSGLVDAEAYGGGQVHGGFREVCDALWPQIREYIVRSRQEDPSRPLMFSGHSIGGAVAVLALERAKQEGLLDPIGGASAPVVLDTFGQPRVGDAAFAAHFPKDVYYHRYVYRRDPVAAIPLRQMGYSDIDRAVTVTLDPRAAPADAPQGLGKRLADLPDHNVINYSVTLDRLAKRDTV